MQHRRRHDQRHEDRTERDLQHRHARTDRAVADPVGEPRFQRGVGRKRLCKFGKNQDSQTCKGNRWPLRGEGCGLVPDAADIGLQRVDCALVDVNFVGVVLNGRSKLLAAQFQRALDGCNPRHRVGSKVTKEPARDLHDGNSLDDQKRQRPVPKPARAKPDRAEQPGRQVQRRRELGRSADLVEHPDVVVRTGAHEGADIVLALGGKGARDLGVGGLQRVDCGFGHDTSVPSITVRSRSARVMTPTSRPESCTMIG